MQNLGQIVLVVAGFWLVTTLVVLALTERMAKAFENSQKRPGVSGPASIGSHVLFVRLAGGHLRDWSERKIIRSALTYVENDLEVKKPSLKSIKTSYTGDRPNFYTSTMVLHITGMKEYSALHDGPVVLNHLNLILDVPNETAQFVNVN